MRTSPSERRAVRWLRALAIVAAAAAALAWIWMSPGERTSQERVHLSAATIIGTLVLLAAWLLMFSGLSRAVRRRVAVAVVAVAVLAAATIRIRGVTGDLIPILEWRWASDARPALNNLPVEVATATVPAPAPVAPAAAPASPADAAALSLPTGTKPPDIAPARDPGGAFAQFLGPNRDGVVAGVRLATNWTTSPPRQVWRRPVGAGWSGFAIADGIAVTQEQRGAREMVVAYRLADGQPLWSHGDDAHYESTVAGEGPRATPTIDRGRVFTLGSTGILNALDLRSGRRLWTRDITAGTDSPQPDWGRSSSPLVVDEVVVVSVGGSNGYSLVAYHRDSGEVAWHAGDDAISYSSPQLATLAGVRQIVILNKDSVAGHDPASGRVLWHHAWPRLQPSVAQPLLLDGDHVLFSAGYGIGSRMLQIAPAGQALEARLVWESTRMKAKFASLVAYKGAVYGLDDGVLASVDPATGERRWKAGRYGHGQLLLTDGILLVQTEEGAIVLVDPQPDEHRELARFDVFDRKTWNPPALAGRLLVVRNDAEAACFELPVR